MLKKIGFIILLSVGQIFMAELMHDVAYSIYPLKRGEINWGLTIHYTFYYFIFLIFIINTIVEFFGVNKTTIIIGLILLLAFDMLPIKAFESRPYRLPFLLTLTNGMVIISYGISILKQNRK